MNYKQTYKFWLKHKKIKPEIKAQLKAMSKQDIKEAFYTDLTFGTGGLRGLMGPGSNRINLYTMRRATEGFARYLEKTYDNNAVAIAHDNRIDSAEFAYEAAMVLAAHGIKTYLYRELRPTPMLSYAVRTFECTGGIMITASHNPKQYNGFKAYDLTGAQLNLEDANQVIAEINAIDDPIGIETVENDYITWIDELFDDKYISEVEKIQINETSKEAKIVFSPLHGTGGTIIPRLLIERGYQVFPYEPQMIADPQFKNTKSSNPEEALSYEMSMLYAKEIDADVIMVTDPDADRLGIAVKHEGDYHLLTGNQTAAIELYYILTQRKKLKTLPKDGFIFSTIVTSKLIKDITEDFGLTYVETLTGFKFIGQKAEELKKTGGTYVFGCEESYGSLIADFVRDKDAVQAVYLLAEIASFLKDQNQTLMDYLNEIYEKYGVYLEHTDTYLLEGISGVEKINQFMAYFRTQSDTFAFDIQAKNDYLTQQRHLSGNITPLDLPQSDVVIYELKDGDWICFRPSGTEPKLKIYYGLKAKTLSDAKKKLTTYQAHIGAVIDQEEDL
ncbi:MAG: phospho-sugar mutase [Acholeplasmataceae bacterium]